MFLDFEMLLMIMIIQYENQIMQLFLSHEDSDKCNTVIVDAAAAYPVNNGGNDDHYDVCDNNDLDHDDGELIFFPSNQNTEQRTSNVDSVYSILIWDSAVHL